jgi:uncharacterized protein (UPF0332 family)
MTDKQSLFSYRLRQAEETLNDAEKMAEDKLSTRSIINRAYYSMFYAVLALFIHSDINPRTSKHSGVIAIFDKEFVHPGTVDRHFSKMLHRLFEARQEVDYKELVEVPMEDAKEFVRLAGEFLLAMKKVIAG